MANSRQPVWCAIGLALSIGSLTKPVFAFASDSTLDVSQYAHTAWKVSDGFTKGAITSIAQTPDGYLWLGTELDLYRFDGVRAVQWRPPDSQHLPDNVIRNRLTARDGTLWIGTARGPGWHAGTSQDHRRHAGSLEQSPIRHGSPTKDSRENCLRQRQSKRFHPVASVVKTQAILNARGRLRASYLLAIVAAQNIALSVQECHAEECGTGRIPAVFHLLHSDPFSAKHNALRPFVALVSRVAFNLNDQAFLPDRRPSLAANSAFQPAPKKMIMVDSSIQIIRPMTAATPP